MKKLFYLVSICCMALLVSFNANANQLNHSYSSTDILNQALPKYNETVDLNTLSNTMPAYIKKIIYEIASGKISGKTTAVKLQDGAILYDVIQGCAKYYEGKADGNWIVTNNCYGEKYKFQTLWSDDQVYTSECLGYNQGQDTMFPVKDYTPSYTIQALC